MQFQVIKLHRVGKRFSNAMAEEDFGNSNPPLSARLEIQSAYTRYLQETQLRASSETAIAFVTNITRGFSQPFRGRSGEDIYEVLTGHHWPRT